MDVRNAARVAEGCAGNEGPRVYGSPSEEPREIRIPREWDDCHAEGLAAGAARKRARAPKQPASLFGSPGRNSTGDVDFLRVCFLSQQQLPRALWEWPSSEVIVVAVEAVSEESDLAFFCIGRSRRRRADEDSRPRRRAAVRRARVGLFSVVSVRKVALGTHQTPRRASRRESDDAPQWTSDRPSDTKGALAVVALIQSASRAAALRATASRRHAAVHAGARKRWN